MGDSHTKHCATNVKSEIKDNYNVQGLVKPGAGAGILVNSANSEIESLTKKDVVFLCGGANDVSKNNSKTALRHIRNIIKTNNHTSIILVSAPRRYNLTKSSFVNNEIKSFNRKLMKSASILETSTDRKLFTNHALHLNGLRKEVLSKQIVSFTYAIPDQKKDPPPII